MSNAAALPGFLPDAKADRGPLLVAAATLLVGFLLIAGLVDLRQGSLFLIGGALGATLYHGSFGFTGGWRRMVVEKRGRAMRAQMLMIGVAALAMIPLTAAGSLGSQPLVGAFAPVGVSVLFGAALFGFGMQLGGGCGSGTLFTVGGGSARMLVTLAFFIVGALIGTAHLPFWLAQPSLPAISITAELGLAAAVAATLAARGSQYLRDIGRTLRDTAYSDVTSLGATAVRRALESANERRTRSGRPPIFTEVAADQWALATATDDDLAASYAALDSWQVKHEELLTRRLRALLETRTNDQLVGIVALVLERFGFVDTERHEAQGQELATFAATYSSGLTEERVAVRVLRSDARLTRTDVLNFRGSLHLYGASRGVIVAVGGVEQGAREQGTVANLAPIDLLDGDALARRMLRAGVGLVRFTVEATCLDDAFFG